MTEEALFQKALSRPPEERAASRGRRVSGDPIGRSRWKRFRQTYPWSFPRLFRSR
jgi:hypothetical protein